MDGRSIGEPLGNVCTSHMLGIFPDGMQKEFIGVHSDSMVAVACLQSLSASLHNDTLGHLVQVFHSLCVRFNTHSA
jgi:hypothetical protein